MTEMLIAAVVIVSAISTVGVVLTLSQWRKETDAQRRFIKSSIIHMRASTPAEAVAAEAELKMMDEATAPYEDDHDEKKTKASVSYNSQDGVQYLSELHGPSEYWINPSTGEQFEVVE